MLYHNWSSKFTAKLAFFYLFFLCFLIVFYWCLLINSSPFMEINRYLPFEPGGSSEELMIKYEIVEQLATRGRKSLLLICITDSLVYPIQFIPFRVVFCRSSNILRLFYLHTRFLWYTSYPDLRPKRKLQKQGGVWRTINSALEQKNGTEPS